MWQQLAWLLRLRNAVICHFIDTRGSHLHDPIWLQDPRSWETKDGAYSPEGDEKTRYPDSSGRGRKQKWVLFLLLVFHLSSMDWMMPSHSKGRKQPSLLSPSVQKLELPRDNPKDTPRNSVLVPAPQESTQNTQKGAVKTEELMRV